MTMFAWCSVISIAFLLLWFLAFVVAHDLIYRVHGKWVKLSVEQFDAIHYAGMAFLKICLLVFNLGPYLALRIVG